MEDDIKITTTALTWTNEIDGGYGTIIKDGMEREYNTQPDIAGLAPVDNLRYDPEENTYILNGLEMTQEEKLLVAEYLLGMSPSYVGQLDLIGTANLRIYDACFVVIKMTDWYVIRQAETGQVIPDIVKQRRAYARDKLDKLPPLPEKVTLYDASISDDEWFEEHISLYGMRSQIDQRLKFQNGIGL